jgi:hypothetical protein
MSDFLALDTSGSRSPYGVIGELLDGPAEVTLLSAPAAGEPLAIRFRPGGLDAIGHDGVAVARARAIDRVDVEPRQPRPGLWTSVFEPDAGVPNRDGVVAAGVVWDVLVSTPPPGDRVLARLAVERLDCVMVGEQSTVVGWHLGDDGREHHTASALLSADGEILARGRARWVTQADTPR